MKITIGTVLERKHKADYLPAFYRVMALTPSGKSVHVQPCDRNGSGLIGIDCAVIRCWRLPLDFEVLK